MLLRTEELGHVPLFQFKTPLQFKITARKLASFIFFLRLQVQEVFKPGSKCGEPSAMHNDNKLPQIMSWGLLNSHTGLGSLWPCQPSTWDDRGWRSMTACRFHVNVHTDDETEANTNMSCSNNTGHEIALEEVSFSPFLAKGNTSFQKKKKKTTKNPRVKHLWRWSAYSKRQRGSVSFSTASGWLGWFQTHPLLQKALTYCLFINHTVGFLTWEFFLQI